MSNNEKSRFEVIMQEDPETGDTLIPLPDELMKQLGWKEGDDIQFDVDDKGRIIIRKV